MSLSSPAPEGGSCALGWLARASFALMFASAGVLIGFAELAGLAMVVVGVVAACLIAAAGYWFLAHRGVLRWLAFALVILVPIAVLVVFARHSLIWVAVVSAVLLVLALGAARLALALVLAPGAAGPERGDPRGPAAQTRFPDHEPAVR